MKTGGQLQKSKWRTALFAALFFSTCLFVSHSVLSQEMGGYASPEEYGWAKYFKYHPAKKHTSIYPFPGPVIREGQDIPLCDAAKNPQAYIYKSEVRYLFHGKDGWLYRTADFRTDFTATPRTINYFQRLNEALASKGQTLIVALQPPRSMMEKAHLDPASIPPGYDPAAAQRGYNAFLQQLSNAGVRAINISGSPSTLDYFQRGDIHWSPEGAHYAAGKIADAMKKMDGYDGLKKQDFESRVTGKARNPTRGAYENFIQTTCKVNIESNNKDVWETTPSDKSGQPGNLLGDDSLIPAVTVVGTSNSAEDEKFNFVGSLKHFLQTDIYNAAIVAGGFGSSIFRYLSSDEYKTDPPKFIIWEFLSQHQYNSDASSTYFRQMIPAVYGACSDKDALALHSGDIKDLKTDLFPQVSNKPLKDAYLYIEVKDPTERKLGINALYADGNADRVDLTRSTRAANNGKYFLDLADADAHIPVFFRLITDKAQGHVEARLCHYPVKLASR